jgi:outer membrane protein, heavy metal efflux system
MRLRRQRINGNVAARPKPMRLVAAPARMVAMSALIAGAASCAHYEPAPMEPHRTAEQFAARQLNDPALREELGRILPQPAEWPPASWDRGQLLAVALLRNPSLAVARAQAQAALAQEITAAERPNPQMTLQSEYARHDPYAWLYGVNLNWLLFTGERRQLQITVAHLDTINARLQLTDQTWAVRRALASALSDWESAHRRLALLERLQDLQEKLLSVERRRVSAGEDPPSELLPAERDRMEVEQQLSEQRAASGTAKSALARALGIPPRALDGLAVEWPDWGEPPVMEVTQLDTLREQALVSRTDLRIAIDEYAAAEARLRLAVARQYPQLALQPGFYWDHGIAKFPFDVSFELPLNRNRGEIAEARAGREVAGQHMLAVQADIYGEIAEAERSETIARSSAEVAARQLASVEQLQAQIVAVRAEFEVLQIQAQLQGARNALEDVLRAPLSGPELALATQMTPAVAETGP